MRNAATTLVAMILLCACTPASAPALAVPISTTSATRAATPAAPTAREEAVVRADIAIEPTRIVGAEGTPIVAVPEDAGNGLAAEFKQGGQHGVLVLPLRPAALALAKTARDPVIEVDASTSFRVLVEVLYTLGTANVAQVQLRLANRPGEVLRVVFPKPVPQASRVSDPGPTAPDHKLLLIATPLGYVIRFRGGNIAAGCGETGDGVAVPLQGAEPATTRITTCVATLAGAVKPSEIAVSAHGSTRAERFVPAFRAALEGTRGEVSSVLFAITR